MYKGILKEKGILVENSKAFEYALQRVLQGTEEEKKEFEEWFYSGNWIEKNEEEGE